MRHFEAEIKQIEGRIAAEKAEYQKRLSAAERAKRDMEEMYDGRLQKMAAQH